MKKLQIKSQVTFFGREQGSKIARFEINHKTWSHIMNVDENADNTWSHNRFESQSHSFVIEYITATLTFHRPC